MFTVASYYLEGGTVKANHRFFDGSYIMVSKLILTINIIKHKLLMVSSFGKMI